MSPLEASRILGLTGNETPDQIRAVSAAQAAALDSRIAGSSGEAKVQYLKDRADVELAMTVLFRGGAAAPPPAERGPEPKFAPRVATEKPRVKPPRPEREAFMDFLFAAIGCALFAIPSAITAWVQTPDKAYAKEAMMQVALFGPIWLAGGLLLAFIVDYPVRKLFKSSPGPVVFGIYILVNWALCNHGKRTQTGTERMVELSTFAMLGTLGVGLVLAIVFYVIATPLGFFRDSSPESRPPEGPRRRR